MSWVLEMALNLRQHEIYDYQDQDRQRRYMAINSRNYARNEEETRDTHRHELKEIVLFTKGKYNIKNGGDINLAL